MLAVLAGLLLSLVALNRWLARRLWAPFQRTLAELRAYNLHQRGALALPATPIDEFTELNQALTQMSARLAADYQRLKDFTENAAHETQTPLAIMQAQLEQLAQDDGLRPTSAALVGELYGATRRLSRLHQALTLLSNIENQQFAQAVPVRLRWWPKKSGSCTSAPQPHLHCGRKRGTHLNYAPRLSRFAGF